MSKNEENPKLWSDFKGVPENIVEMGVDGANRNLKLPQYYILGAYSQIQE